MEEKSLFSPQNSHWDSNGVSCFAVGGYRPGVKGFSDCPQADKEKQPNMFL